MSALGEFLKDEAGRCWHDIQNHQAADKGVRKQLKTLGKIESVNTFQASLQWIRLKWNHCIL